MKDTVTHRFRRAARGSTLVLAALAVGACSIQDSLLEQQQPQVIKPEDTQSSTGAIAIYNGVLGRLRTSLNGGNNNTESIWNFAGIMSDEIKIGDTFAERINADQRTTQDNDGVLTQIYNKVQQSRGYARDAINTLTTYSPSETVKIAEMYMVMGIMETTLGENFCNGIPLGETLNGVPQYTPPLTNIQVFNQAIARYDTALTMLSGQTSTAAVAVRNATLIAKARTQVDLGQFAAAATTVAGIPTAYTYLITYSATTQSNEWWQMATSTKRYSVADTTDGTGFKNNLPFASANDPRVKVNRTTTKAFDGSTNWDELQNWAREDGISLVNGLDARLIEAEAQLQQKNAAGWLAMNTILNTLRATPPKYGNLTIAALTALPVPTSQVEAENQFFREKAFWQYGRGQRLSDMRRLVRQYTRPIDDVYPTGNFHKTGVYGPNVAFPVPDAEKSNPNFNGCLDRKA